MAKCAICGKGAHFGNAVSHSKCGNLTSNLLKLKLTEQLRKCTFVLLA